VSFGVIVLLHCGRIDTHGRFAYNFKIPRHAGKTVVPLTEHDHLALRVGVDDPGRLRDLGWPGRRRTGYFDLRRIVAACRRTLIRRHRLSRAAEKHSSDEEWYRSGEIQKGET
jgi:hypothetical protein